jgi:hypothetical protein
MNVIGLPQQKERDGIVGFQSTGPCNGAEQQRARSNRGELDPRGDRDFCAARLPVVAPSEKIQKRVISASDPIITRSRT